MAEEKVLTRAIAENFLFYRGGILGGFTSIEDDAAEALAKYQGNSLNLIGLKTLSGNSVDRLRKDEGEKELHL
jgi:hypothetical protein